jgi:RecA-family ATPase
VPLNLADLATDQYEPDEPATVPFVPLDLVALAGQQPQPTRFVVPDLVPAAEVTLFTGAGSAGKSLLGQQLATAVAAGVSMLGWSLVQGPAIYLTCEDGPDQLHWRQAHICQALGVPMASLAGKLQLFSRRGELGNELAAPGERGLLQPTATFEQVAKLVRAARPALVVLDNVGHLFAGNENDRGK